MQIEPELGRDFQITEYPDRVELTSTLLHGLTGGIEYLCQNGYKINHGAVRGNLNMYIIPAVKGEATKDPKDDKENVSLKKDVDKYMKENRNLKSQITRLKNKIEKIEKG